VTTLRSPWPIVRLGDVAETALGKMLDRGKSRGYSEVPYLRNVNVQWDQINTHDLLTMELDDKERARFGVSPGDLLVCEGGEVGRAAIWRGRVEYLAYQKALHRIRSNGQLDLLFLRYLLEHYQNDGTLAAQSTGSTIAHLPQQKLRALPVPFPDPEEQRRIVNILEDHLSHLAAASALVQAARSRAQNLLLRLLESLVPAGVPRRTLGEMALDSGYGTSIKCTPDGSGVPVVRIPNLRDGRVDLTDEKRASDATVDLSKLMLEEDDLLVVRTNGSRDLIGRTAVVQAGLNASFASYLIRFKLDPRAIRPQWARNMLDCHASRRVLEAMAASSAGQYNLGLKKLNSVSVACPPLDEQDRLLLELDLYKSDQQALTRTLDLAELRCRSLRRSLLAAAFSGQLTGRASDLDRVEETAGV
jgi:type I restriction enzyme, S subunit